jgi:hypothetical protein
MMVGGPPELLSGATSNHLCLLPLRVAVVSIRGKGRITSQVSIKKTNEVNRCQRRRKDETMSKPETNIISGRSSKET